MPTFELTRTVAAPPEVLFDVLTDHRGLASITPLRRVDLEREGTPAPNGVGAVRALHLAGPPVREEMTAYERPHRFAYRIVSGVPVRSHLAEVTLTDAGDGRTHLRYLVEFTPRLPGSGLALGLALRGAVTQIVSGATKKAERTSGGAPS